MQASIHHLESFECNRLKEEMKVKRTKETSIDINIDNEQDMRGVQ